MLERLVPCLAALIIGAMPALAGAEPVSLKLVYPGAVNSTVNTQGLTPWIKRVEQDGDGTIEIKLFAGGTIATYRNVYDRLLNSVVDVAYGLFGELSGQFPRSEVVTLPFEAPSSYASALALWRLYERGLIGDEYGKVHPLAVARYPYATLHARKPVKTLADLNGMKLSAFSRMAGQIIEALGATPVTMPVTEVYQSVQRGLIDGTIAAWTGVETYKYYEVTSFHLEAPIGANSAFVFMNKDSYARLSGKAKEALDKNSGEALTKAFGLSFDAQDRDARALVERMPNHTVNEIPAGEIELWKARVKPSVDAWEKATPDGARVLAAYRAEVAKIAAEPKPAQ